LHLRVARALQVLWLARSLFVGWTIIVWLAPLLAGTTLPLDGPSIPGWPTSLTGWPLPPPPHLCYSGWTSNPTLTDTQAGPTLAPSLIYPPSFRLTLPHSLAPQLSLLSNRGNSPSSSTLCLLALIVWYNKAAYLCRISTYV
jgi:hypothetical protein